jgi:hypothetical protein
MIAEGELFSIFIHLTHCAKERDAIDANLVKKIASAINLHEFMLFIGEDGFIVGGSLFGLTFFCHRGS